MFGYIVTNQQELKLKEYERYKAYYCGLCRSLKRRHGKRGQLTLNYDMTFLSILLNCLYESKLNDESHGCFIHPFEKHRMLFNNISDYAADMGILLTYYNLMDNWKDDHSIKSLILANSISNKCKVIESEYERQAAAVKNYIKNLSQCENEKDYNLDKASGLTGMMLGEIFVFKDDVWSDELRQIGFFLGKYIYLMDAFEDIEEDIKKKSFNPWIPYASEENFESKVETTLIMMMSECAKAFEKLPIVEDIEILRNIIYAGIWSKFEYVKNKRHKKSGDKNDIKTV